MTETDQIYRVNSSHQFYIPDESGGSMACVDVRFRHGVYWLTSVSVDKAHRGKGLATRLINHAIAEYGTHDLYLNVYAYNDQPLDDRALVAFYGQFGFVSIDGAAGQMVRRATQSGDDSGETVFVVGAKANRIERRESRERSDVPSIGRIVHYVDALGAHCAAIIIGLHAAPTKSDPNGVSTDVALAVFDVFKSYTNFVQHVPLDSTCAIPLTWHWPERT